MKTNLFIILSSAFCLQLGAHRFPTLPKIEEGSLLFSKKEKKYIMSEDGGVFRPRQVVKLNLTQALITNPTLQYEFAFHKNMSGALSVAVLIPRDLPGVIFTPSEQASGLKEGYDVPRFGGWAVTPEFRFYPGPKVEHQAPHGFYLAPYFRYSKFKLGADYWAPATTDANGNTLTTRLYNVSASFSSFTGGLMIGSQWIIGKHFSIDWWILGGGAGKGKLVLESKSDDLSLNMSPTEQAELRADIEENLGQLSKFSNGAVEIETTPNSAKLSIKGIPSASYRGFGLCFGFSF